MHNTMRRGFTLIEIMVVMSIMAVLATIGIAALMNINSNNAVDRAAEEITTAIRESQNKAISVASDPTGSSVATPLAWGVYVDSSAKSAQPFYIDGNKVYQPFGSNLDYNPLASLSIMGDSYYFFTTPFGKYYSTTALPGASGWNANLQRPYDIIPSPIIQSDVASEITLLYRNSAKNIVIETNGDVHVR